MSNNHTPGPIRVGRTPTTVVSDQQGPGVPGSDAPSYGGFLIGESIHPENARRIAACWNACEGISTERLASDYRQGADPWSEVEHLRASRDIGPSWQPLTTELLARISQKSPQRYWLAVRDFDDPLIGVYEWRQGRNPDGFNTNSDGRICAVCVTHIMPLNPPALPSA